MRPKRLTAELVEAGFSIKLDGGKLEVSPASRLTDNLRQAIRQHKDQIISELSNPEVRTCPTCSRQLASSGKYHFWCESGHYDLHEVIPTNERANYCRICHDPLINGACNACQHQPYSIFAEASNNLSVAA